MSESRNEQPTDVAGIILALLASGWIWLTAVLPAIAVWATELVMTVLGYDFPTWIRPLVSVGQTVALWIILLPLGYFWRRPRYRAVFRAWLWGALAFALFGPVHLIHPFRSGTAALAQIAVLLVFGFVLHRRLPPAKEQPFDPWLPLVITAVLGLGWLAWGAFGSWLEIVLNVLSALAFGWVIGLIIGRELLPWLRTTGSERWNITLAGWAVSNLVLMVAMAYGWNGQQVLLLGTLWLSGWLLAAVAYRQSWQSAALLLAGLVALPLTTVDTDEMLLAIFGDPLALWTGQAMLVSLVGSFLFGLLFFFLPKMEWRERPLPQFTALVVWLIAFAVFIFAGQPGTHSDRLFVIMADQADVSEANGIEDATERRAFVYNTLVAHANKDQQDVRRLLDRLPLRYRSYYLVNAIEVDGGPLVRLLLEQRNDVDRVIDSPVLRPLPAELQTVTGSISAPPDEPLWNLTDIGAVRVWEEFGARGEGIVIGQSDSGVQWDHPELLSSYRGGADDHVRHWYDPYNNTPVPFDHGGHGTHTLGSVLGDNVGVAPEATWFGCANLDRNLGNAAVYLDCMQFMLAPHPQQGDPFSEGDPALGAHVLNNSWGCPDFEGCDATSLQSGAEALRHAGIFVVVSAGNEGDTGCGSVDSPLALYDAVFSVGASDRNGRVAGFSSRGPVTVDGSGRIKPDILAPGVNIFSAYPNNSYEFNEGTSMAGPHVAGVVALLWSAAPELSGDIDRTEQLLRETAVPYAPSLANDPCHTPNPQNIVGAGIVNVYAAVQAAVAP